MRGQWQNPGNSSLQDVVEFEVTADGQRELGRVTIDNQISRPPAMAVDAVSCCVLGFEARPGLAPGQKLTIIDRRTRQVSGIVPLVTGAGWRWRPARHSEWSACPR